MSQPGVAAYVQVANALRTMALAEPWDTDGALPAEPVLVERFQVSRGTLRRATEELAREGLLRIERGRGTTVRRQAQLRAHVRDRLARIAVPDSRWHLDVLHFVPDFEGSELARTRILEHPAIASASTVFVAPDNSLSALTEALLYQGKHVVVPTYGMRRGMVLLTPDTAAPADRAFAATLDGLERFGTTLDLAALRGLGRIDALVTGAIAFTVGGLHIGSGTAYFDIEWAILATLGLVDADTPVLGVAHEIQIVDAPLEPTPLDVTVDAVATPDRLITTSGVRNRPTGIIWPELAAAQLDEIAYLRDLSPANDWIR